MSPPTSGPTARAIRLPPASRAAALGLLATSLGCASAAPYGRLAAAGGSYASAVESLARAAAGLAVDASSARLLQDDALASVDLATYRRFTEADRERSDVLARLASHARLLRRYFALLGELAAGGGGSATVRALDGVAAALDEAGEALRGRTVTGGQQPLHAPAKAAAAVYGKRLARREVAARAPLLQRELEVQRSVLAVLEDAVRHDSELLVASREQRLVIDPLLAETPVADPERWIADRAAALAAEAALAELDDAVAAAQALATAIAAVCEPEPDLSRVERLLAEVEAIAAALDAAGMRWRGGS